MKWKAIITQAEGGGFYCHVYKPGQTNWTIAAWDVTVREVKNRAGQCLRENLDLKPADPLPWQVIHKLDKVGVPA